MNASNLAVEVIFLGTGTSHGIPMIGCTCPVCTSTDSCDRRTRPSIAVRGGGATILVDTAPELRLQCVANGIDRVDAVLFTHAHADHVTGFDDLRRFDYLGGGPVPAYASSGTGQTLRAMFAYAFEDDPEYPSVKPRVDLHTIEPGARMEFGNLAVRAFELMHGSLPVLGFRFGDMAYCTDCNAIPPESLEQLQGLDVLILDGLRRRPHPTHFNLEQAVAMAERIGARRTFFTHIAHELPHAATNASLPEGMALAYDGLVVGSNADERNAC